MMLLHIGIASIRQFQRVPAAYITEKIKKCILKFKHLSSTMPIVFASLQHVELPVNVKIPVTIWLNVHIYVTALASNLIS